MGTRKLVVRELSGDLNVLSWVRSAVMASFCYWSGFATAIVGSCCLRSRFWRPRGNAANPAEQTGACRGLAHSGAKAASFVTIYYCQRRHGRHDARNIKHYIARPTRQLRALQRAIRIRIRPRWIAHLDYFGRFRPLRILYRLREVDVRRRDGPQPRVVAVLSASIRVEVANAFDRLVRCLAAHDQVEVEQQQREH